MAEIHSAGGTPEPSMGSLREAVGLFNDPKAMERAVEELLTDTFEQHDISILAREQTVKDQLSHRLATTESLADDATAPREGYPAPEARTEGRGALASMLGYAGAVTAAGLVFATGGTILPAIAAGLVAGGGAAAAGIGLGNALDAKFVDHFERQIEQGGIIVWVRVADPSHERTALEILARHGAHDVHVHELPPPTYQ